MSNNKLFNVILLIMVGILSGLALLFCLSIAMQSAILPIRQELKSFHTELAQIDEKLSGLANISTRLAGLEGRLANIERKGVGAPAPAAQRPPEEDMSKVHDIPLEHSYVLGNKNATVTIVEFVDFQCPFCARFHAPLMEVMKTYPQQVKYILKNFPLAFHPEAKPAAKAALAAGEQGKFYEMADLILENAQSLGEAKYKELAKQLGLNENKFWKDYTEKDAQWEDIINKDMDLGRRVDVRGTPTFYINGRKTMARDFQGFKREIDTILNEKP